MANPPPLSPLPQLRLLPLPPLRLPLRYPLPLRRFRRPLPPPPPPASPLLNLLFQFDFGDYLHSSQIDSWIHRAVNHGVTEIDADFFIHRDYQVFDQADGGYSYNECYFTFYFNSIKNSRVRVLKLSRCELILPLGLSTSSSFKSVQSLYLDQIYLNDEMVSDLISGCPNLESLVLEYCCDMKELRIRSTRLKRLSLLYFHSQDKVEDSVEICAPNLRSFRIVCFEMGMYSMEGTTGLAEAYVEFMHEERHYKYWSKVVRLLSGVKHLVVENWWFKLHSSMEISSEDLVFNNLTSVELRTGYATYDLLGIAALLECSPNLEILTVSDLFKIDEDESLSEEILNRPIKFSMTSLRQVKIKSFAGSLLQWNFVELLIQQQALSFASE
ncbi:hypothetical protein RHMOL_Rhmol04G0086100 [Rhododendron molle]|uniref:Uncharacterized protein n=1 Tax=Rhododendron molle TaxID=49168 RepID=A0ACC0NZN4_RHOML|nr:hypothetical protein RHMOL_Rhmol04G0086100 [Rhododendron molle]